MQQNYFCGFIRLRVLQALQRDQWFKIAEIVQYLIKKIAQDVLIFFRQMLLVTQHKAAT